MTSSTTPSDPRGATGDDGSARKPAGSGAADDRSVTAQGRSDDDVAGEAADPATGDDGGGALDEQAAGAD
jgi:hypothetical protein